MNTSGGFSGTADTLVRSKTPENVSFWRLVDLHFPLTWESMELCCELVEQEGHGSP